MTLIFFSRSYILIMFYLNRIIIKLAYMLQEVIKRLHGRALNGSTIPHLTTSNDEKDELSQKHIQQKTDTLDQTARVGLQIDTAKSKIMRTNPKQHQPIN